MQRPVVTILILVSIFCFSLPVYAQNQDKGLNPILSLLLSGNNSTVGLSGLMGAVRDVNGDNLPGVVLVVDGNSVTSTNYYGKFSWIGMEPAEQIVINISKPSYVPTTAIVKIQAGLVTKHGETLHKYGTKVDIDSTAPDTINYGGGSVTIPANALVDSTGTAFTSTATVYLTIFDPTIGSHRTAFPGKYEGTKTDNSVVPFGSFGFWDVTITDSTGNKLQLATGQTADVVIPIPASLVASAQASIILWDFDETSGMWTEQGTGTKNGSVYEGTVSHFSMWSFDEPYTPATITGRITCGGEPVGGAFVGMGGDGWGGYESSTPTDGTFTITVKPDVTVDYSVVYNDYRGTAQQVTSPSAGSTLDIGDIVVTPTDCAPMELVLPPDPISIPDPSVDFCNRIKSVTEPYEYGLQCYFTSEAAKLIYNFNNEYMATFVESTTLHSSVRAHYYHDNGTENYYDLQANYQKTNEFGSWGSSKWSGHYGINERFGSPIQQNIYNCSNRTNSGIADPYRIVNLNQDCPATPAGIPTIQHQYDNCSITGDLTLAECDTQLYQMFYPIPEHENLPLHMSSQYAYPGSCHVWWDEGSDICVP